jgi:hypothetical protein
MPVKRRLGDETTPRPARHAKSLTIRDFLALVDDGVRDGLGKQYASFESRQRFGYVQYWRGAPFQDRSHRASQSGWMHYEIWVQRKTQRLEIGLHFEGDRDRSYAAAELLAERALDITAAVGPEYELEEWTPSWTRLHRSFSAPTLTPTLAAEAGRHACDLIKGMEPVLKKVGLR